MNQGKQQIDAGMPGLVLLVMHRKQRNRPFDDPENQQTPNNESQPFQWTIFEAFEVCYNVIPHISRI
jgi:hypothetical protein